MYNMGHMNKLTKRELDIMDILWKSDRSLSANEIREISGGLSIYTVQQVLQRLLKFNYVRIDSIGQNKKALMRLYVAEITQEDYFQNFLTAHGKYMIASNFIESNDDLETLQKLSKLIDDKIEKLKK